MHNPARRRDSDHTRDSSTRLWHCELMHTTMEPSTHPQAWPQLATTALQGPRVCPARRTALAGSPPAETPSPLRGPQAEASCGSSMAPSMSAPQCAESWRFGRSAGLVPGRCLPQTGSAQAEQAKRADPHEESSFVHRQALHASTTNSRALADPPEATALQCCKPGALCTGNEFCSHQECGPLWQTMSAGSVRPGAVCRRLVSKQHALAVHHS